MDSGGSGSGSGGARGRRGIWPHQTLTMSMDMIRLPGDDRDIAVARREWRELPINLNRELPVQRIEDMQMSQIDRHNLNVVLNKSLPAELKKKMLIPEDYDPYAQLRPKQEPTPKYKIPMQDRFHELNALNSRMAVVDMKIPALGKRGAPALAARVSYHFHKDEPTKMNLQKMELISKAEQPSSQEREVLETLQEIQSNPLSPTALSVKHQIYESITGYKFRGPPPNKRMKDTLDSKVALDVIQDLLNEITTIDKTNTQ